MANSKNYDASIQRYGLQRNLGTEKLPRLPWRLRGRRLSQCGSACLGVTGARGHITMSHCVCCHRPQVLSCPVLDSDDDDDDRKGPQAHTKSYLRLASRVSPFCTQFAAHIVVICALDNAVNASFFLTTLSKSIGLGLYPQ